MHGIDAFNETVVVRIRKMLCSFSTASYHWIGRNVFFCKFYHVIIIFVRLRIDGNSLGNVSMKFTMKNNLENIYEKKFIINRIVFILTAINPIVIFDQDQLNFSVQPRLGLSFIKFTTTLTRCLIMQDLFQL